MKCGGCGQFWVVSLGGKVQGRVECLTSGGQPQ